MHRKIPICAPNVDQTWCWANGCEEDGEIFSLRKNMIIKSTGKNQHGEKTSLKKRSGTLEINKHSYNTFIPEETTKNSILTKQTNQETKFIQGNKEVIFQKTEVYLYQQMSSTPQKTHVNHKKINFVYTTGNKAEFQNPGEEIESPQIKAKENLSIDLSFKEKVQFTHSKELSKSTQMTSESPDHSPGFSQEFKIHSNPLIPSQRVESSKPLISLSSRKRTVVSIDGDSESMESFAVFDLEESIPFTKSITNRERFGERVYGSNCVANGGNIKSSINF